MLWCFVLSWLEETLLALNSPALIQRPSLQSTKSLTVKLWKINYGPLHWALLRQQVKKLTPQITGVVIGSTKHAKDNVCPIYNCECSFEWNDISVLVCMYTFLCEIILMRILLLASHSSVCFDVTC